MDALGLALAAAALLAGLTGTWSPCGFSMIETIGPVGHTGGRAVTLAACVTFTVGALVGGAFTFGALAALGALAHGAGDALAYAVGAGIATVAAIAEIRGTRILPQVRRQLPEPWRRLMPMPVAAGLYGVLLGLGFTTFVLSFAVFALAGIAFAVGEPGTGIAVGLAFGVGRALPVVLVAPVADRPAGIAVTELMAGRPGIYRGFRVGDGLALLAAAAALVATVPASASRIDAHPAADPSAAAGELVFQRPNRFGFIERQGRDIALHGRDPAAGDGRLAVIDGGQISILSAVGLERIGRVPATDADAIAISRHWLVWRARTRGRDLLRARNVSDPERPGPEQSLGRAGGAAQLGRPSLDDNRLVYARATRHRNVIVKRVLGARRRKRAKTTLLRSITDGLSNPSIRGRALLYVRHTRRADRLKLARVTGRGSGGTLLSRRGGTLWSTALSQKRAYVTQLHGARPRERILSVAR
jgi:hypothetical protein